MTERTHFVYEAFDADGLLLYVGCTANPANRYRQHMAGDNNGHGWFDAFVTHWRVSGPYRRETAFALEKRWIAERHPIWNGHTPGNRWPHHGVKNEYLAFHGVRFERNEFRNRPDLVPAKHQRLGSVAS